MTTSHLYDDFSSQKQDGRFFQEYTNRAIFDVHTLEAKIFQEFEFFKTFEE